MKIKVIYLARLSEDIGKKEEYIRLRTVESQRYRLSKKLNLDKIKYSIYSAKNYEHSDFKSIVKDGDEIAFFPTITGG